MAAAQKIDQRLLPTAKLFYPSETVRLPIWKFDIDVAFLVPVKDRSCPMPTVVEGRYPGKRRRTEGVFHAHLLPSESPVVKLIQT